MAQAGKGYKWGQTSVIFGEHLSTFVGEGNGSPLPTFKKEVTGISVGAASGFPLRESERTPQ